ncbi:hypothetical protein V6N13_039585 [Hibiscus sabdariffa]
MATPPIRYEMNDENQFMLCRSCRNHLGALGSNCYGQAFDGLVCLTADNVRTDETPTSTLYDMPAMNVYCSGCDTRVGGRIEILQRKQGFYSNNL